MSMNLITLLYLVASVFFIQALKGLSHPTTSRRGNLFGMLGMAIAVLTTVGLIFKLGSELATTGIGYVIVGLLIGAVIAFKTGAKSSAGSGKVGLMKLVAIGEKIGTNANARVFTFAVKLPKE